jgi:hypothetical protein
VPAINSLFKLLGFVALAGLTYQLFYEVDQSPPPPVSSYVAEAPLAPATPPSPAPATTFQAAPQSPTLPEPAPPSLSEIEQAAPPSAAVNSACRTKYYCNQMKTCAEAKYHLDQCGLSRLDADSDGIPCETVCGKTTGTMTARLRSQPYSPDAPTTAFGFVGAASGTPELTCAGKRTCKQMDSCEEATFYLTKCGVRSLDGNWDGVACNGLC